MAAKDADLARSFSTGSVYFTGMDVAAFEIALETTPKQVDAGATATGDRSEELVLVGDLGTVLEAELLETGVPIVVPDNTPPTISNFAPAQGTGIEPAQILSFDVTDDISIAAVVILASFPDGSVEVVHDNDGFRGHYVGDVNSRTAIAGGYNYTIRRIGGWLQAPTIEWVPVDTSGNIGIIT